MKLHIDCEQGSPEWHILRAGLISASCAGEIYTPTGKPATGAKVDNYINRLIAERVMGKPAESGFTSSAMERGHVVEIEARAFYEMATGLGVTQIAMIQDGDYSCSPDGLIYEDGEIIKGLEIKSPLAHTQVSYLMRREIPTQYIPQLQLSMYVSGLTEWDFLAYHPDLDPLLITCKIDHEWLDGFLKVSEKILSKVNEGVKLIKHKEAA
jgi:hypothetical protein